MKYRPEIDGLRALAVLIVILFHAGFESISGGYIGVDVFFVISGYLITSIIISEIAAGEFSVTNFYERRARRLLPALFFVMIACVPFALLWLAPSDLKFFGQSIFAVSTFWSNIFLWKKSGYFESDSELDPLLHTWSLSLEEQFYILFPIFLVIVWKFGLKLLFILLGIIFLISLSIANYGAYNHPSAAFYFLPTRGWELLVGSFCAFFLRYKSHFKSHYINEIFSLLGFGMIILSVLMFDDSTPFPSLYTLVPTVGTLLLVLMTTSKTIIYRLLAFKPIVGLGLISYSAYLWHQPLFAFTKYRYFEIISQELIIFLCFISFGLAWLTWRFVERPFRIKGKYTKKKVFKVSILSIFIISLLGNWLNFSNGNLKNYSYDDQEIYSSFFNPSDYLVNRRIELRLRNFDENLDQKKVMVIGDSHSEDILNALFESGLKNRIQVSSYFISNSCGVLFVDKKYDREDPNSNCKKWTDYEDKFFDLLINADEVWIVSAWKELDLKYMRESISNLKNLNEQIRVFGIKDFGYIHAGLYKKLSKDSWSDIIATDLYKPPHINAKDLNKLIKIEAIEEGADFINIQGLLCGDLEICPNYIDGGIISYDGSHLTPFGASFLGKRIQNYFKY